MLLTLFILEWILVIILIAIFILLVIWMVTGYRSKVPFVSIPSAVLPDVKKALEIKDTSIVYDLGCGDGKVLFYLYPFCTKASYRGIENSPFPLFLSRLRAWWNRKFNDIDIEIINQDFFNTDLSDATHIFCYLYPNVMDDLLLKFENELKDLPIFVFPIRHKIMFGEEEKFSKIIQGFISNY